MYRAITAPAPAAGAVPAPVAINGMGAYPGDPWFDRNRPAWLPYWIDTFNEEAQRWGFYPGANLNMEYKPPPMPAAPKPPANLPANPADRESAQAAVDAVVADTWRRQQAQTMDWIAAVDADIAADQERRREAEKDKIQTWVWGALAIGAGLLFIRRI